MPRTKHDRTRPKAACAPRQRLADAESATAREAIISGLDRRKFLQVGASSVLGLAGMVGCAPEHTQPTGTPEGAPADVGGAVRSPWFTKLPRSRVRCDLCPHRCELADGERARCRVRVNVGGEMVTLAYGNPSLVQDEVIERSPFFHVLPGTRALSIATAGCNLACKFCEVWDMALVAPEDVHTYDMPPETVVAHAKQTAEVRSISYAFGEPTVFYEYMAEVAGLARKAGLLNLVHTAGYIQPKPLAALLGNVDAANVDLKSFDPAFYREVVGGELEPVLETLKTLKNAGVHIEITNIVIPTLNDEMTGIRDMCRWIATELGPATPIHFARFYPLYRLSNLPQTPVSTLDRARHTALNAGLEYVYVSRVTGHDGENTFCPSCGKIAIKRIGFVIDEIHVENGRCGHCAANIPGRWA